METVQVMNLSVQHCVHFRPSEVCWFNFAARHWMGNECYSLCLAGRSRYVGLQAFIKSDRSQFFIFKKVNVGYIWKERLTNLKMTKRICYNRLYAEKQERFGPKLAYLISTTNLYLLFIHLHQLLFNTRDCFWRILSKTYESYELCFQWFILRSTFYSLKRTD